MKWDDSDFNDSRIVEFSDWIPKHDYKDEFEHRAGVYVFANKNYDVKYIGKAKAGRMIDEIYDAMRPREDRQKDNGSTLIIALYTNSSDKAIQLEKALQRKYDPPLNFRVGEYE